MTDHEVLIKMISTMIPEFEKYFIRPYVLLTRDTVSNSQLKILLELIAKEKSTMSDLARDLEMSRPQLTSLVDGLVRIGFVERCGGLHDRRIISVTLTPKAKAFYEDTQRRALEYNESRLGRLTELEKSRLYEALETVHTLLAKTELEAGA